MFALIKDGNGIRIVKSNEVEEKANFIVRGKLNDFFDDLIIKNGEDYRVTVEDADLFESHELVVGKKHELTLLICRKLFCSII